MTARMATTQGELDAILAERDALEGSGKPIEPVAKRRPGRPRKPRPEDQTSQAG
jgi:hypothetical protein